MKMRKKMTPEVEDFINNLKPKVCALAYISQVGEPIVCQMGFAVNEYEIILHTNTWTRKWKEIQNHQKVSICMGFEHLANYIQLQGIAQKVDKHDQRFVSLENIYLLEHPDSVNYKKNNQEGIFLVSPFKIRYATVYNFEVVFNDYVIE